MGDRVPGRLTTPFSGRSTREPRSLSGGHSVFAHSLLKSLRNNTEPYFTSYDLFSRLDRAVTTNSDQKPVRGTVNTAGEEGSGDFTFILR